MDYRYADDVTFPGQKSGSQDVLLVASLLHLMSHYSARRQHDEPCIKLACVIERHLAALSRLQRVDPVLRATCEQLRDTWGKLVEVEIPILDKRNLFVRLVSGDR